LESFDDERPLDLAGRRGARKLGDHDDPARVLERREAIGAERTQRVQVRR
jgi:hypothetical protein